MSKEEREKEEEKEGIPKAVLTVPMPALSMTQRQNPNGESKKRHTIISPWIRMPSSPSDLQSHMLTPTFTVRAGDARAGITGQRIFRVGGGDVKSIVWRHSPQFCVNGNTGFKFESRIFYFIHLQNETRPTAQSHPARSP